MEALLQAGREAEASQTLQNPIWLSRPATADSPTPVHLRSALSTQSSALPWYQSRRNGTSSSKTSPTDIHSKLPITVLQGSQKASHLDLEDVAFNFEPSLAGLGGQANYEESEMPSQEIQWEKYASGSWMSVCSQPGQRWVCKRTGSVDFVEIAKALALGLKRRLTIEQELSSPKAPDEPDEATAWTFVQAYFDSSYDSLFGIVNRPAFEARWRDDFVRGNSQSNDPSWVALRYVVYAAGCRCHLAKDHTISFIQARAQAWQYFEKALSLFKDIIFTTKGLTAVQALALMALYAEGLGCPSLEYLLAGNAARMAQYNGLHRQPARSWRLSDADVLQRNWLWWTVYALDKQIAFQSGRPSAIDDKNISAQVPTMRSPGTTVDVEAFTKIIEFARILSQVCRRILSVEVFQQSPHELVNTVNDLHDQLVEFRDSLPVDLQFGVQAKRSPDFQSSQRFIPVFYLHFAVCGSLMATHLLFFYPWIAACFRTENKTELYAQLDRSSTVVAEAARSIICAIRGFSTTVAVPAWLAFYYPMYAQINLFIYLLKYPHHPNSRSDLALLDICTGHFGQLEILTSFTISFPFAREAAGLAYRTVKAAVEKGTRSSKDHETGETTPPAEDNSTEGSTPFSDADGFLNIDYEQLSHTMNEVDAINFDSESWDFAPSFDLFDDIGDFGSLLS